VPIALKEFTENSPAQQVVSSKELTLELWSESRPLEHSIS